MEILDVIRVNLLSPMVLAFLLGVFAVLVRSDLRIPEQVYTIISIYLLFAIGLKGGFDLAKSPLSGFGWAALVAIALGVGIVVWSYLILHKGGRFAPADAAALAIHFGGVSAVTLSACVTFLAEVQEPFEGFMPALYVIMEIPAVAVGLLIAGSTVGRVRQSPVDVLRSALSGKSFMLLGGGVVIGYISGELGERQVGAFFVDLFPGMLALFLLEMGTLVGKRLGDLRHAGIFLTLFGLVMPLLHGLAGVWLGDLVGLSAGGSMIMGTLAASASYITAPAVVGQNIPKANPGYYLTAALVITFPFNLTLGLPIYYQAALWLAR